MTPGWGFLGAESGRAPRAASEPHLWLADPMTVCAPTCALIGALHGAPAIPAPWRWTVLTCRPHTSRPAVQHPRPLGCWPVDALLLAERLLVAGAHTAAMLYYSVINTIT